MRPRKHFTREFKPEASRPLEQGQQGNSTPTPISVGYTWEDHVLPRLRRTDVH